MAQITPPYTTIANIRISKLNVLMCLSNQKANQSQGHELPFPLLLREVSDF